MKILDCPLNGPRNISEFVPGGPVKAMPDPETADDAWADYVWMHDNVAGVVTEWWCHVPTSYWFLVERNTVTDEIIRTYPAGGHDDPAAGGGGARRGGAVEKRS